jgi:glycosyltransferase involved in cell wall biosynthesis
MWQRPQHIMSRLSKKNKIIIIEDSISISNIFKNPNKPRLKINGNVIVYSPLCLPLGLGNKSKIFRRIDDFFLNRSIKKNIKKFNLNDPISWFYNIKKVNFAGRFNEKLIVYDCVDEHSAFTGASNEMVEQERSLIEKSDLIFVSSEELYKTKRKLKKETYIVTNAADINHFMKAMDDVTQISKDIAKLPKPIVGYVGGIWDWFDSDIIEHIAKSHPEYSIVLIGHINKDVNSLKKQKNVYLLGSRDFNDLPAYLKGFDVCIIPFKINRLTKNADPIKLYEYMATGKPIVSVDLPEVQKFSKFVKIAKTKAEFSNYVSQFIIKKRDEQSIKKQIEAAKEHSWDNRVKSMVKIIESMGDKP